MSTRSWPVSLGEEGITLQGELILPAACKGLVLFAHGSGSSRFSPRNQFVAHELQKNGLATLLMDLLEESEAQDRSCVFDIGLLANRLGWGVNWLRQQEPTQSLPVGLFGASTGAAAALVLAARLPGEIAAVVSRGGRPDLAWDDLPRIGIPTLLIVGGNDPEVLRLNQAALARLPGPKKLEIVPRATHLFPEPGTLETVAQLAGSWFLEHLPQQSATLAQQPGKE